MHKAHWRTVDGGSAAGSVCAYYICTPTHQTFSRCIFPHPLSPPTNFLLFSVSIPFDLPCLRTSRAVMEGLQCSEMWAEDCPIHHKLHDIVEQLDGLLLGFPAGCATSTWFIILSIPSADWECAPIKSSSTLSGGSKLRPPFLGMSKSPPSPRHSESLLLSAPLTLWFAAVTHKNYRRKETEWIVACLLGSFSAWRHSWMQQHLATKSHHLWGWQMSQLAPFDACLRRRREQLLQPFICVYFWDKQRLYTLYWQKGKCH